MEESRNHTPSKEKDRWDKISIGVDISHKLLILMIGSVIAAIFFWFQQKQVESRYFADLMAQREGAESQLRAQMFKTLFDAYFANKLQERALPKDGSSSEFRIPSVAVAPARASIAAQLERLKQEAMFTDLLSRNFESIDVRPLFEDLDWQLSALLEPADKPAAVKSTAINDLRPETFTLREQLRRVAVGASSRQITALAGGAGATETRHRVTQCRNEQPPELEPPFPFNKAMRTLIDKLQDGVVMIRLVKDEPSMESAPQLVEPAAYLRVTFYDMPSLENIVLPTGERVALTLSRYISYDSCKEFKEQFDESLRADCEHALREKQACDRAWISVIVFPKGYIGVRDRPHLADLVAGKFRQ